ncbi:DUF1634 domain-containing protein [Thermus tengchongensis]|uniref:DUF1634 domain-containing protein n=1 Tax=Thermus tengchongensis TaxID=1214928 RepID=A0A4Y9FB25_9DEIN|nr:DUF1634 domain-containing protein [Thermus tengchongensis]
MDLWISWTLRVGVLLSALMVLLGGLGYLAAHGATPAGVGPSSSWSIWPPSLDPLSLLRLGLLLLILTPVARVALSVFLFERLRLCPHHPLGAPRPPGEPLMMALTLPPQGQPFGPGVRGCHQGPLLPENHLAPPEEAVLHLITHPVP